MTDALESIRDLAQRAFKDASSLTHGEIVRLAAFIADHDEHVRFGAPATAQMPGRTPVGPVPTPLMQRIEGQRPRTDERPSAEADGDQSGS